MTDQITTDVQAPAAPLRLTRMGGESLLVDFKPNTTVGRLLDEAGIPVNNEDAITMSGRPVKRDTIAEPGASVVVAARVRNG